MIDLIVCRYKLRMKVCGRAAYSFIRLLLSLGGFLSIIKYQHAIFTFCIIKVHLKRLYRFSDEDRVES